MRRSCWMPPPRPSCDLTLRRRLRGFNFREGSRPSGMPKADAMGLAPEKSAFLEPPEAFTGSGGSLSLVSVRINISMVKLSERKALGIKTRRPPEGRSKLVFTSTRGSRQSPAKNVRNSAGNNLRISGGKIVTRYNTGLLQTLKCPRRATPSNTGAALTTSPFKIRLSSRPRRPVGKQPWRSPAFSTPGLECRWQ